MRALLSAAATQPHQEHSERFCSLRPIASQDAGGCWGAPPTGWESPPRCQLWFQTARRMQATPSAELSTMMSRGLLDTTSLRVTRDHAPNCAFICSGASAQPFARHLSVFLQFIFLRAKQVVYWNTPLETEMVTSTAVVYLKPAGVASGNSTGPPLHAVSHGCSSCHSNILMPLPRFYYPFIFLW